MPTKRLSPAVLAAAALAGALAALPARADQPQPPSIAITGEGVVSVPPDLAVISSGVTTRDKTASAALAANAAAMTKVLAALKAAGVEDRDVGTSGLNVQPVYENADSYSSNRAPKLVGYDVRNTVSIRSRNVDKLGSLVDALVAAGSNQIDSLAFDVSDKEKKLDDARKAAVAEARRKAELYAQAAGVKLGKVLSLDEDAGDYEAPMRPFAARAKAMDAAPTPIARGEKELRVRVTVRWALEG